MEEDNLPSGKSDSLLINALCFFLLDRRTLATKMHLNVTLRTDQNGKKRYASRVTIWQQSHVKGMKKDEMFALLASQQSSS